MAQAAAEISPRRPKRLPKALHDGSRGPDDGARVSLDGPMGPKIPQGRDKGEGKGGVKRRKNGQASDLAPSQSKLRFPSPCQAGLVATNTISLGTLKQLRSNSPRKFA